MHLCSVGHLGLAVGSVCASGLLDDLSLVTAEDAEHTAGAEGANDADDDAPAERLMRKVAIVQPPLELGPQPLRDARLLGYHLHDVFALSLIPQAGGHVSREVALVVLVEGATLDTLLRAWCRRARRRARRRVGWQRRRRRVFGGRWRRRLGRKLRRRRRVGRALVVRLANVARLPAVV